MCSVIVMVVIVVVMDVLANQSSQMPFVENNHTVEQVSTTTADQSFCNTILPWNSEARTLGSDARLMYSI
jgi:hypothetical protein